MGREIKKVFVLAGLPEAHSHMPRDTFSVRLLLKGVPLETVAALFGNIKVCEKHYAPRVHAWQNEMELAPRRVW